MRRIRVTATIDDYAISPDSIKAAQEYLTGQMFEVADVMGVAVDWGTFHTYARRNRSNDLTLVQWARTLR